MQRLVASSRWSQWPKCQCSKYKFVYNLVAISQTVMLQLKRCIFEMLTLM